MAERTPLRVALRVRPFLPIEISRNASHCLRVDGHSVLMFPSEEDPPKRFEFDFVFPPSDVVGQEAASSQLSVFTTMGADAIKDVFRGIDAAIINYGASATGKSHTMFGSAEDRGLIFRCGEAIFDQIQTEKSESTNISVSVSVYDIYNERLSDLLNPGEPLKVRERKIGGVDIQGLTQSPTQIFSEFQERIETAMANRRMSAFRMNSHPRGTVIVTISLSKIQTISEGVVSETRSKLTLGDLAGSERFRSASSTSAEVRREMQTLNKSTSSFRNCVVALANRTAHVPFRDSKLSFALRECLQGNCRTSLICTLSPAGEYFDESIVTLRFGEIARRVTNQVSPHQVDVVSSIGESS